MILALIGDGATFVACRMAARLFWTYSPVDFAAAHISPQALIASRAPPDIARAVFARRRVAPCWSMMPLAADTGSIRTVEWVSRVLCDYYHRAPDDRPPACPVDDDHKGDHRGDHGDHGDDDDDEGLQYFLDLLYDRPLMSRHSGLKDDPLDPWARFRTHVDAAAYIAARAGAVDIIAHLHDTFRKAGPDCGCSPSVGKVAFHAARSDVVEWLAKVGCRGRYRPGYGSVRDAVIKGNPALVEWTVRVARPWHRSVTQSAIRTLAARNDVVMVDLVARLGLYPLSSDDVAAAAGAGSLDFIRWAAGEAIKGAVGTHDGPRVADWCSTKVVRAAAKKGMVEVVRWLVNHSHATHFVGASAVRRALSEGHCEVVRLLHEAGRADFGRWDALEVAVFSASLDAVSFVADNGGIYGPRVLAIALEEQYENIIGYLLARYSLSASDVVEAIHIANESRNAGETDASIDLLVDRVPAMAALWPAPRRSDENQ